MTVVGSVVLMVLCALLRGYTSRRAAELKGVLIQLEAEHTRARHDRERAEVVRESAQARRNDALHRCERVTRELAELEAAIERLERDSASRERDRN